MQTTFATWVISIACKNMKKVSIFECASRYLEFILELWNDADMSVFIRYRTLNSESSMQKSQSFCWE